MPDAAAEVAGLLDVVDGQRPSRKWSGSHGRLVDVADLAAVGTPIPRRPLQRLFESEFVWPLGPAHIRAIRTLNGRTRR